ncbi:response regulator [Natranaerobius thermophilus]|uniref:Stage 0 sporulation protein A homolog n=1 Tax=Natranaerobius thermophilus (strain ATCC BAA-1301 / DSM 18059 / JW/NM-WN-LF) TaxID=457570 RepID=B2A790_NATTJ|nr:response regulator transcription factor [Natranaerobius thermophilus]ACB84284.1 two component transcriptional regulator, LuxR family [Natranaerobius thermophilus JW/NM-WN-LF]
MYQVLIVDDHEMIRLGLKEHLLKGEKISHVSDAENISEALKQVQEQYFHVIIMDVRLKSESGVQGCQEVLEYSPDSKVIMLTAFDDDDALIESILAGASGYLMKEVRIKSLVESVIKAAEGEQIMDAKTTEKVLEYMRNKNPNRENPTDILTNREMDILDLVAKGKTNSEIGEELHLSEKTVRNQLSRILNKLDLNNRTQAAAYYVSQIKEDS